MFLHSIRASRTFTIFVVCVAVFADVLLQNLVVPVLPYALRERVGLTNEADLQRWNSVLIAAFGAAWTSGSFLFGVIADHIPTRRTPFILALLLSLVSTLFFALGSTLPILLSARLLEGLSTAVIATVGPALMLEVVGQRNLGHAMGFSSMAMSMGLLLGPVLGGVLYEYCGYFVTFLPALVLLGVEAALRGLIIEKGRKCYSAENDSLEDAQSLLPKSLPPLRTMSQRHGYLVLLRHPRFLTTLTVLFALSSTVCGFDAVLVPYISSTFDLGPVNAAALFLALAIPMLFAPLTGYLTDRYGPKVIASSGLAIWTPALAALSLVGPGSTKPMLELGGLFFLIGIAQALTSIPLRVDAAAVVGDIEKEQPGAFGTRGAYGMAFGFVNGMVAAGGMAGPLVAGFLRIQIGWVGMAWVMGGVGLCAWAGVVIFTGGRFSKAEEDEGEVREGS
ncbi:major facilitator superfamily domain-containing protein [Usnea florida]